MSKRNMHDANTNSAGAVASHDRAHDAEWVEIFKDRIAEELKLVLQEDMDWMTSRPILDRLNRLRDIEQARLSGKPTADPKAMRGAS